MDITDTLYVLKTIYNHIVEFKASDRPVIDPLSNLFSFDQHSLKFWDLPVRNFEKTYQEITSANRGSNLPFPADFSFHLRYTKKQCDNIRRPWHRLCL